MVSEGAVWINHRRMDKPEQVLIPKLHILSNGLTLIRVGKKNFHIIKWLSLWGSLLLHGTGLTLVDFFVKVGNFWVSQDTWTDIWEYVEFVFALPEVNL